MANQIYVRFGQDSWCPQHGMVVTIYMVGEIETEATLEWCGDPWNAWTARPAGKFRDNNETWEDNAHRS
jgi:hypothetical protein